MITKYMKPQIALIAFAFLALNLEAQISHGGEPFEWKNRTYQDVSLFSLPSPDLDAYRTEDVQLDQYKNIPYRFGANIPVDIDLNNHGTFLYLENGDRIWQMGITSPGAVSLNFVFDQYQLAEGGHVFVYSPDKKQLLGSFTSENTSLIGSLGVGFIQGESLIIEYYEPAAAIGTGYLHIDNVTHAYRSAIGRMEEEAKAGPFGNSGACNINVNCPEGLPYEIQIRSAAIIVVGNSGACSGALVNNTALDFKPYFLTANHCLPFNNNQTQNWIFYFNHEAVACNGNTGPTNQSVSGATVRAKNALSDFALVEFNTPVPASYNACYSGWDATDLESNVSSAYGIHHPNGDVKKICFENDAPNHVTQGGFAQEVWWIDEWELGVTEPASSGSPLFNQDGMIIGQLAGGAAACSGSVNNGEYDFYGRFGVSWNTGSTPTTRLRDWLDPGNTGQLILANSCIAELSENDISLGEFSNTSAVYCGLIEYNQAISFVNIGGNVVTSISGTVNFNGITAPLSWTGSLASGQTGNINLGLFSLQAGPNTITVNITTVNGGPDPNPIGNSKIQNVTLPANPQILTLNIIFDEYPDETFWEVLDLNGNLTYSGGPYSEGDIQINEYLCVDAGCYEFIIYDDYGDGICCEYGEGSYNLLDPDQTELASGGIFTDSETTEFCVGVVGINDQDLKAYWNIMPNPANDLLKIEIGKDLAVEQMQVFDLSGRMIHENSGKQINSVNSPLNISNWPSGIYLVQLQTNLGMTSRKLVVAR